MYQPLKATVNVTWHVEVWYCSMNMNYKETHMQHIPLPLSVL